MKVTRFSEVEPRERVVAVGTFDGVHVGHRAVIGRAVAELPVQIGIEIRRSPAQLPTLDEIFEKIANGV